MKITSITLTPDEIAVLIDGLDAYRYWQLTAENGLEYLRSNGDVKLEEIEDDQVRAAFEEVAALESRLEAVKRQLEG